jgi:hypothetical protein
MDTGTKNPANADGSAPPQAPARRLVRSHVCKDPDMDLFFLAAMGWGCRRRWPKPGA